MLVGTWISDAGHAPSKDLCISYLLVALRLSPKIVQSKEGLIEAKDLRHETGPITSKTRSALDEVVQRFVGFLDR